MPISFNQIPAGWKQPLYWVEIDGSMAGYPQSHMRSLLVGTMTSKNSFAALNGVAIPDVAIVVGRQMDADHLFGVGSELACQVRAFLANNWANELWCLPVHESTNSIPASGTITVSGTLTDAGTISLYIAGYPVRVNVGASFTVNEIATAIYDAIMDNSMRHLPVTADPPTAAVVTLHAKWGGVTGNEISMLDSYYGKIGGEVLPPGLILTYAPGGGTQNVTSAVVQTPGTGYAIGNTITLPDGVVLTVATLAVSPPTAVATVTVTNPGSAVTPPTNPVAQSSTSGTGTGATFNLTWGTTVFPNFLGGGVGFPDFTNAISNLGETEFEYVNLTNLDSTSLMAWETEFSLEDDGRWGWMRQLYGTLYAAKRGIYSDLVDWGLSRNGKILSVLAIEPSMPSPCYEISACYCSKAARALTNDPARPLQTLHLESMLPAPFHARWNLMELNTFSMSGLATQRTLSDNVPMIARETTTYQLNLYGYGDDAFELVTTLATLAKLIRNQRYAITTKFPRHKLADDGTRFGAGQAIVTPSIIKAELVAEYRLDEFNGLVENANAFKANLIVERDPNDPNRVNVLYPPDLVNQLRIFAVLNQFRLQYNRGIDEAIITTGAVLGTAAGFG